MSVLEGYVKLRTGIVGWRAWTKSIMHYQSCPLFELFQYMVLWTPVQIQKATLACSWTHWLKWYKSKALGAEELRSCSPSVPLCRAYVVLFILMSLMFIGSLPSTMQIPPTVLLRCRRTFLLAALHGSFAVNNEEPFSDFSANHAEHFVSPLFVQLSPVWKVLSMPVNSDLDDHVVNLCSTAHPT